MQTIAYAKLVRMLDSGAARVEANHDLLSRLDAATGDGDHGTTMVRTCRAIVEALGSCAEHAPGPLLEAVGWSVMSVDGGSTSPLLGSFFMGMGEAAAGQTALDAAALAGAFEAGLSKLRGVTPAQVGDKTMLDALVPAVAGLREAADAGRDIGACLAQAAAAAAQGAESTAQLQAKFGRARNLGPRTLGHVDPGATTISLFFAGFRDGLIDNA